MISGFYFEFVKGLKIIKFTYTAAEIDKCVMETLTKVKYIFKKNYPQPSTYPNTEEQFKFLVILLKTPNFENGENDVRDEFCQ